MSYALLCLLFLGFTDPASQIAQDVEETESKIAELVNGKAGPYQVRDDDDELTRLRKQRINVARLGVELRNERFRHGPDPVDFLIQSHRQLMDALLDFHTQPMDQASVLSDMLANVRVLEEVLRDAFQSGIRPLEELTAVMELRLEVEIKLRRLEKTPGDK